jgi:type III restriction enzyme
MAPVVIENPVINSPFAEPIRHFAFNDAGITDQIVEGRRISSYFVPIARPKKRATQPSLYQTEWTQDRVEETKLVNEIRGRVAIWRKGGYAGVTNTTRQLLEYWTDLERERKFFFCQVEALETAIYIAEVAKKYGDAWIDNRLRDANESANPGLFRTAFKMATGSGKTVVMAMLIAWQALNKLADPQDARFSDAFLIVAPGITIRDRLRVLLPSDPGNYYRQRDIVPSYLFDELGKAKIVITNFHAFKLRELGDASKLTKAILANGQASAFTETPEQMVRRVCSELGNKKNICVINDEAHHCYRTKPQGEEVKLTGEERKEAQKREEEARIWLTGIEAAKRKIGVRAIYDLSATPFFLQGSGYAEGTLFPWVVSDFSLIDAIECGIVKVPRVPVADDADDTDAPKYLNLWQYIREDLPKKGARDEELGGEPKLPVTLEGALHSLYTHYEKTYRLWERDMEGQAAGRMPPVFIVVCSNTSVSRLVFNYIGGWERQVNGGMVVQAGKLDIFRNDDSRGGWLQRPNTILVDSEQLESGEGMSDEFKRVATREIEEFKAEYRLRFPGRDVDKLTDEDLLREVMNTVGKQGKLGEHVKCVVSVSMLTEGWDANTVTHILGVRAFGTQLLSEQVVGRALRRTTYAAQPCSVTYDGKTEEFLGYTPEYADIYGVRFSFIPTSATPPPDNPKPPVSVTRVRALEDRIASEITFPRLTGYRYEVPPERLDCRFTADTLYALTTEKVPSWTETAAVVGEMALHTLDDIKRRRPNEVAFRLAELVLKQYFRDEDDNDRPWLFPQILAITKRWLAECLRLKDNTFVQMLLFVEPASDAAYKIYLSIVRSIPGEPQLKPVVRAYDPLGSTREVDFDTARPTYLTHYEKCHVSHCVLDSGWEGQLAQKIEDMPEVLRYVKNFGMGFTIPYSFEGDDRQYVPDYILCIDDGRSADDLLNLVVEVTGEKKKDKAAKVATARNLWVPAVNNSGRFGRWSFLEIEDIWDAVNHIRNHVCALNGNPAGLPA